MSKPGWAAVAPIGLVLLMLLPGAGALGPIASTANPHAGASASVAAPTSHPAAGAPAAPPLPPSSTGRGTFFDTTSIADPAARAQTCFFGTCVAAANDPVMNLTSGGVLGVAYTVYTNASPCPASVPYALSELGFVSSTNGGSTWSAPTTLGNPDCTTTGSAVNYPSAWEPTLTSLANGTLVLAYIEYNTTSGTILPYLDFGPAVWSVPTDRLVVSESYNGGTTWSTPLVVATGANPGLTNGVDAPQRPWLASVGQTLYLAWVNLSTNVGFDQFGNPAGSSAVQLSTSTDGGATWSAATALNVLGSPGVLTALNPTVAVGPNGALEVAYATNFTFAPSYGCTGLGCVYNVWTSDVLVASSTNNGTTFSYATAAPGVLADFNRWGMFRDPSPQLAIDGATGQTYVTYSAGVVGIACTYGSCYTNLEPQIVFLANRTTAGASWSTPTVAAPELSGFALFGANLEYNPAIAVSTGGIVHLTMTFDNYSICQSGIFGNFCGPQQQLYLNSSDHGATFGGPVLISNNWTQLLYNPNNPDGEYDSIVSNGANLWIGWSGDTCPVWATAAVYGACGWPGNGGVSAVQLSSRFTGTGVSLTFSETGLPAGGVWKVDVMGNARAATAPANLVVSGIPAGLNITWNLTELSPYGTRYFPTPSLTSPYVISASTTVTITFATQYLVNLTAVPDLPAPTYISTYCFIGYPSFFWDNPTCPTVNWNLTPAPGPIWVNASQSLRLTTAPVTSMYCTGVCFGITYLNVTFLSWKGTGAGSANTTVWNTTVTAYGPINETASYTVNGWCAYNFAPILLQCLASNASIAFHESGLPTGTTWGVTATAPGVNVTTNTSNTDWITIGGNVSAGIMAFNAWTVPDPSTGKVWVPSASPLSPVELPIDSLVQVNYTLVDPATVDFPITMSAVGVPEASSWSYTVDGVQFGASGEAPVAFSLTGGTHTLSGGAVTLNNSTRLVVSELSTSSLSVGASAFTNFTVLPATITVKGPVLASLLYVPQYWLTLAAGLGGTVSPASQWVAPGIAVPLSATPSAGYKFVGWSGNGPGATNAATANVTITPYGVVHEVATFAPLPTPTFNVTVNATGLPAGAAFTIGLGNRSFSGASGFVVRGLLSGTYAFSAPYAYDNASHESRYLPSLSSTSFAQSPPGSLIIGASGDLTVAFVTQTELTVGVSGGGTVSSGVGSSWLTVGASVTLTASANPGAMFDGWTGSGPGAVNSSSNPLDLTVTGAATEIANFVPAPVVLGPYYNLTVNESGLPAGLGWTVELTQAGGVQGSAGTPIDFSGLAGGGYTASFPSVTVGSGTRYVPTPTSQIVSVGPTSSNTLTVTFAPEFLVSASAGTGGNVSATVGGASVTLPGWFSPGTVVILTSIPDSGEMVTNWTVPGGATVTGSTYDLNVTAPSTVLVGFAPIAGQNGSPASGGGSDETVLALALLVVLAVVGAIVGLLLGRRRSPPANAETPAGDEALVGPDPEAPSEGSGEAAPGESN